MVLDSITKPEGHHGRYILDYEGNPVPEQDLMRWATWYATRPYRTDWIVGTTIVSKIEVSTVFLALDHQWGTGPPLLYETMCRGCKDDDELAGICERYATRQEAEAGHERVVEMVLAAKA